MPTGKNAKYDSHRRWPRRHRLHHSYTSMYRSYCNKNNDLNANHVSEWLRWLPSRRTTNRIQQNIYIFINLCFDVLCGLWPECVRPNMNCMCNYMKHKWAKSKWKPFLWLFSTPSNTIFSVSTNVDCFSESKNLSFAWLFFVIGRISKPECRPLQLCVFFFWKFSFCLFPFSTHSYCLAGEYATENRKTSPHFVWVC